MNAKYLAAGLLLALAAAGQAQSLQSERASPPLVADPELPASDLLLRYESPELRFRWSLAPEAALEPGLVRDLRSSALADRERAIRDAAEGSNASGRIMQYEWVEEWRLEAETDQLLAFSTQQYSYSGGAHGGLVLKGVLWDRAENRRISFAELFADPAAMWAALRPIFCAALDEERQSRRDGEAAGNFGECIEPSAYPVVPEGDGEIRSFRILVPPYEAGPWVEGPYEISMPVSIIRPYLLPRYDSVFAGR